MRFIEGFLKLALPLTQLIREGHKSDVKLVDYIELISQGKEVDFKVDENGVMRFHNRVCVPNFLELKRRIMEEGHRSSLSIHPRATKMYQDLEGIFWWPSMKKDVALFVYSCLTCQKSKIEHQQQNGLTKPLSITE
jgi:hypothetical protein